MVSPAAAFPVPSPRFPPIPALRGRLMWPEGLTRGGESGEFWVGCLGRGEHVMSPGRRLSPLSGGPPVEHDPRADAPGGSSRRPGPEGCQR